MKDTTKIKRKIVKIDESKCTGCGQCVTGCVEGALQIVNGKAKLVSETYCDGLGACIGECPEGAIIVEERQVSQFDQTAVDAAHRSDVAAKKHKRRTELQEKTLPCGCPSSQVRDLSGGRCQPAAPSAGLDSGLANWPIQLALVPPTAPFLQNSDLVISADCVSYAYGNFHQDFLKDKVLIIACPKLDDSEYYLEKLTALFKTAGIKSVTVLHMEVPCCSGLVHITKKALGASGKKIPAKEITISIKGGIKSESILELS
ncbi:MAG: 4Fe-4S binding protein [Planctomycetota bacterium]